MNEEPKEIGDKRDNLGRFAEGNPGGPGRPTGTLSLVGLLKKHLEEVPDGDKRTRAQLFIEKTLGKAMKGDPGSEKLIWNYIEGLPQSNIDVTSGGKPIPILNVLRDERDTKDSGTQEAS